MSPIVVRTMLVTYITARRAGPTPINRFLTMFPDAGASERELLVSLNADLLVSEMVGADMDAVFDEMEVSIGADLIREVHRGITDAGCLTRPPGPLCSVPVMIFGSHVILYSSDADAGPRVLPRSARALIGRCRSRLADLRATSRGSCRSSRGDEWAGRALLDLRRPRRGDARSRSQGSGLFGSGRGAVGLGHKDQIAGRW